jgi:murein DD-endopeptidase MepM/ murein hydrolase activator NlpD
MQIVGKRDFEVEKRNIGRFLELQWELVRDIGLLFLGWVLVIKDHLARSMYRQRGRFSQSFVNTSMAVMAFLAVGLSGKIEELIASSGTSSTGGSGYLVMAVDQANSAETLISDLPKGEVTEYRVQEGDTVSGIAQKFGVSIDTIIWENDLKSVDAIKPKQILRILPETGIRHSVKRGETVYSIAKYYSVDAQNIIDYPFNTFSNDETFALTAGQELFVPDGIKPKAVIVDQQRYAAKTVAPIPGVVGEGTFNWPTSGTITQRYSWYHPAVDIASKSAPGIIAAQGGTVVTAGWNAGGYGNYVIVDHGNGYKTLYAHMIDGSIVVKAGDRVNQGQRLGTMGSTGRSTGPHLHFEIISSSGKLNPLTVLK